MSFRVVSLMLSLLKIHSGFPTLPPPPPPYSPGELLHVLQELIQYPPLLPHHSPTTLLPLSPVLHVMCLWIYTVLSLTSSEGMGLIAGPLCGLTQGPDLVDVGRVEVRMTGPGWVPWVAPSSAGMRRRREIQACLPGEAPPSSA